MQTFKQFTENKKEVLKNFMFKTEVEAKTAGKNIGITGTHKHGKLFMPGKNHKAIVSHLEKKGLLETVSEALKEAETVWSAGVKNLLNEDLRLSPKDKKVIMAFLDKKDMDSKKLSSERGQLDGMWMGGSKIAWWNKAGKIEIGPIGGRAAQTVAKFLRKNAPKFDLSEAKRFVANKHDKFTIARTGKVIKVNHKQIAKVLMKKGFSPESGFRDDAEKVLGYKHLSELDFNKIIDAMWELDSEL